MGSGFGSQVFNVCPVCQASVEVTAAEAFSLVACSSCGAEMRARADFDHFLIQRELGVGGMSLVFEASDTALHRPVALKVLNRECSADGLRLAQFEREARLTAGFAHPNIVKVYSVGRDQGYFYIAMELVPGGSLDERIRSSGAQPEGSVLGIAAEVVQGLKVAREVGLIHRDIKPGNILFAEDGAAKLVDFGLALMGKEKDESKEMWATPYYVPPEKLDDEPDTFRGDMYSLGATLYHALAGVPPIPRDTNSIEELKILKTQVPELSTIAPDVSEEACAIINRLLAKRPEQRYPSYEALLEHLIYAEKALARNRGRGSRTQQLKRRRWRTGALVSGVAVVVLVGVLWIGHRPSTSSHGGSMVIASSSAVESDSSVTAQFTLGREALLAGKYAEAQKEFLALLERPRLRTPSRQWTQYNLGLAAALAGDSATAMKAWAELPLTHDWKPSTEEERALQAFFLHASLALTATTTTTLAEGMAPLEDDALRDVALLPLGLKAWLENQPQLAREALGAFRLAVVPSLGWIESYKALSTQVEADLAVMAALPPYERGPAVWLPPAIKALVALKLDSPVKKDLGERILAAQAQATAGTGPEKQAGAAPSPSAPQRLDPFGKLAADRDVALPWGAAEEAEIRAILTQAEAHAPQAKTFAFAEAAAAMPSADAAQTTAGKALTENLRWLWQGADHLVVAVSEHLTAHPWTGDVEAVAGTAPRSTITKATPTQWTIKMPNREVTVAPSALHPVFIAERALDAVQIEPDPARARRLREDLVCFASVQGLARYTQLAGASLKAESQDFASRWGFLNQAWDLRR
jgi:eukaryotic-like serine/threonine-protein kinase